ncbi:AGE family epimerase/isomerase [Yinghuangia seranimata]|uniref:AGE family epimerase/isomerase n=1 Tax=Yinghuangia seranimata TaxID=408067 RepID=UPI00248BB508|nr:AGE family epimerase/isomerase [Yinghuangia seranimata]MDI2131409.1 AGE family epimerase/isomerase [Yinghuangia seranimata]
MNASHHGSRAGSWVALDTHRAWLDTEADRLLRFAAGARLPEGGFGWLDAAGSPDPARGTQLWITTRMTHVFGLAALRGVPGAAPLADHGLAALCGPLRDPADGGWYPAVPGPHTGPQGTRKEAYGHAFVLLAAATLVQARRPGAKTLLADATAVFEERFWDDKHGWARESWDRAWTEPEAYLGANANMHTVEAFLAVADATGDPVWRQRALRVADFFVHHIARGQGWRVPEHFTPDGFPLPDYNADAKADPFRPYGTTPGHSFEWARLLLNLEATLPDPPDWLADAAGRLFVAAVGQGWNADGGPGFVYTVDADDKPVVRARMHWVAAEAIAAAAALHQRTGDLVYEHWYRLWWDYTAQHVVDPAGGWHHELGPDNRPSATVWAGQPDVYHAYQATLLPQLPLAPGPAAALRARLDGPA